MSQHCPGLLTIPFDEMAGRHNMELKRIPLPVYEEEDDGDDHSVEQTYIGSTDKNGVMVDTDPTISDGELKDELQYQRLSDGYSSERP
jgi:hypothetical protein